ncbi:quinol---cytochrome-c reductase [Powellomyces hirtus]|uniref:Cytochrome b-c1 complex subunit Rieske, mitochondrial n=1 Tax=Powellomyces hirtus TaxID=109895 RepID=A0A507DU50_9FUNG|nr:quinol---cytochrome-c reductase [Powellomyces hirtus]
MASKIAPSLLTSRTYWARPISAAPTALTASAAKVPKATVPLVHRSVNAHINGAQLSSRTNFTANNTAFSQKRFYAAPVYKASPDTDVTQPPREQDAYKLQHHDDISSRNFAYFMIGTYSFIGAAAAKNIVTDYLVHFAASADVLALAKVEVDMASIPEGKNVILKWRGKPVFIRHRTAEEIAEANSVSLSELRDPETDADRTKKPEWLVMLGVCTHLGCVPIGEAGEYGGWFCPCHGSHYDISGRIRKGPAPLNLEVPAYDFNEADGKIVIG